MSLFGGGKKPAASTPSKALGIDFQGAQYGPPIPVVYGQNKVAGNCIWYGEFQAIAVQQKQSGGKGGGGSSSTTSYDYKASYQLGLCEGPGSVVSVYNGTSTVSLSTLGGVTSPGTQGQAPWSHLTGSYALGYSGTVLVSFPNRDLGSSASLPNDNFEVAGLCQFGGGIVDANPADILTDICTNAYHGINFGQLGNLTQYSNYCVASGIFLSPVYDQQQTGQQTISDLLKYTNADGWFSEGVLKIGCYGDQTITGNGVTYTPNVTAVADLGPDDFITNGADAPVTITRKSPADAMNIERLEYVDRANTYHTSAITATIDNDIVASGARSDQSDTFHGITNATVARLVTQNILQRNYYVRNEYAFQLSWRYCYLEPFDTVTLNDVNTGLSSFPVRLLSVEEDEHGLLSITAEEFPLGIGHGGTYSTQPNGGANVDPNSDPGPVASPYLFRGPGFLVSNNKPEIWCAVTGNGNALWAGCDVYLSHDGTSYTFLSTYARQARYGSLTNSMAVQVDPDTTSAPNVVLNGYNTQLLGGSQADADNFTTLAMIDNEIVAYENATLASGPSYTLGYLRRGGYGSTIAAHSAGAPFVRLDDGILRIPVDPSQIGQTIYIKFLSRNCFGRTPRTLAGETAYTYVVGTNVELPDVPNVPDNFAVLPVSDGVQITWTNDNPAAAGCTSIEYATASGGPFTVLDQVGPTTTSHHHGFTSGSTYYYRARARGPLVQSGWSAYTSVLSSTGVNVSGPGGLSTTVNANQPLITNPYFTTGDLTGWTSDHGTWAYQSGSTNNPSAASTTYAIRTGSSGTPSDVLRNLCKIPVYPGAQVKAQCLVRGIGSPNGTCGVRISWRDGSDAELSVTHGSTTTGTATNATYVVGSGPVGCVYAHIECEALTHTTGSYSVDNFAASLLTDNLDQVPDGGTYSKTLGSYVSGGKPVINFADTIHANKSLDFIPDGGVRIGSIQYSDGETVDNANFEAASTLPVPGWAASAGSTISYTTTANAYAGNRSLQLISGGSAGRVSSTRSYKCSPDDVWLLRFAGSGSSFTTTYGCLIFFNSATGASLTKIAVTIATGDNTWKQRAGQVQAPAGYDYFVIAFVCNTANYGMLIDDIALGKVRTQNGIAPITWAGVRSVLSTSPIAYSISGTTVHFSVAAFTNYGGGNNPAYSASSGSVTQAAGTTVTYYLYYRDPTSAGGAQTLFITTNVQDLATYPDVVNIGSASVTVNSGGGGSGGTGGGGGGYCVADEMFIRDGMRAGDADIGDPFDCIDLPTQAGKHVRALQGVTRGIEECVRMITSDGCVLVCSVSTPFDLPEGRSATAQHMLGEQVITDLGIATVTSLALVGQRSVTRAHLGGVSYAAGAEPQRRIYSHNAAGSPSKP